MTTHTWTPTNRELQERICNLIGLDFQSCQQVTIKLTLHGTVEVDAQYYLGRYEPEPTTKKSGVAAANHRKKTRKKNA